MVVVVRLQGAEKKERRSEVYIPLLFSWLDTIAVVVSWRQLSLLHVFVRARRLFSSLV
jgi:hypothetical protein